ncbi:MAG: hypothetical protein STSR0001_09330 [Methanothrix sp.]|jgi:hypothetical protein
MTKEKFVFIGATINAIDKEAIDRIAEQNSVSKSYVTRMLIADSIQHIKERNIFNIVV